MCILRSSASTNYFESFGFYVNILGVKQICLYQDKYHMAKRCIFLSMCHLRMQGVPRCGCGATFLCFLGKCHIWFKTAGLNPDGDENNNNNNKRNGVYWIIYTPYVTSLHKLSSSISQFCSGKQFLL